MSDRDNKVNRRNFMRNTIALSALGLAQQCGQSIENQPLTPMPSERRSKPTQRTDAAMPTRTLGRTGLEVSMIAIGGGSQFPRNSDKKGRALLEKALELGVNFFDTRDSYGTEPIYGEMLKPYRDQIYIQSKTDSGKLTNATSAEIDAAIRKDLEGSLERLQTDYLDSYLLHSHNRSETEAAFDTMRKLKEEGKTRFIGFSSMSGSGERQKEMIEAMDPDIYLCAVNATGYGSVKELAIPAAHERNAGILGMKTVRGLIGTASLLELMSYVLDLPGVASLVVGNGDAEELIENVATIKSYATSTGVKYDHAAVQKKLAPYAGPHALCWARPDYHDFRIDSPYPYA